MSSMYQTLVSKQFDRAAIKLKRPMNEKYVCFFEHMSNLVVVLGESGTCHKYALKDKKTILVAGGVLADAKNVTMELRLSYQIKLE